MEVKGKNFYEVWKKMLKHIIDKGIDFQDGKRICREVLGLSTIIEEGNDPLSIIERLNEFEVWVYPNEEEIKEALFSKKFGEGFSFGSRVFDFEEEINQIDEFIIPLLRGNKESRRAIVSLWDPKKDSMILKKDVPGIIMFDFKLKDDKLNVSMIIRSDDVFFGFPADAYKTYLLQDYICKKLNVKRGQIHILSTSAHIFDDQIPYIEKVLEE